MLLHQEGSQIGQGISMVGFSLQTQPVAACCRGQGTSRVLLDALEVVWNKTKTEGVRSSPIRM